MRDASRLSLVPGVHTGQSQTASGGLPLLVAVRPTGRMAHKVKDRYTPLLCPPGARNYARVLFTRKCAVAFTAGFVQSIAPTTHTLVALSAKSGHMPITNVGPRNAM